MRPHGLVRRVSILCNKRYLQFPVHQTDQRLIDIRGPFLAILAALGGKYAADKNQGPIGDSTKAVGRIAASAGRKAKEERLFCKIKAAIRSLFGKKRNCHCENCEPPSQGNASKF